MDEPTVRRAETRLRTHLECACGSETEMLCFFGRPDPHGVCARCGRVQLIRLESGQTVQRFVCNVCWEFYRRGQLRDK